ncbi:MAG: CapA family protein [Chloroflexi bacterium]|nr:CapA family protein [Chloroflexota bacterium]
MLTTKTKITVAITGESLINRRLSVHTEDGFLSLLKVIREADVAYTHLETMIHDYDGPETYPAAEGGGVWQRSPRFVADELRWAGFHLVSLAHNHVMDYSYGGLFSTLEALDGVGLVHAGAGRNLGEAREPAYLDTARGRVALISMTSSFPGWARAGEARRDVKGRPGLNPLRFNYVADLDTIENVKQLAFKMGWQVSNVGKTWLFNAPGNQMSFYKFMEGDKPGIFTVAEDDDVQGNLRSIRDAARQADYVLVHVHSHESDPDPGKGPDAPPTFIPPFAKLCIDAGAHVFIGEGGKAPKGIEIYKGRPIFYGPGAFIGMITVTRLPSDFYERPGYAPEVRSWEATTADGLDAFKAYPRPLSPPGRSPSAGVEGSVVALCSLGEDGQLTELILHPITGVPRPRSRAGLPMLADARIAQSMVAHVGELSVPFGTNIRYEDGRGFVGL